MGRPKSEAIPLPVYDSMKACCAATGIPMRLMRDLKGAGCDAFRSNRVDLARLLPAIWAKGDAEDSEAVTDWSQALAKVRTEREQVKLGKDRKQVVDRGFVKQEAQGAIAMLFGEIDRTFCTQLPPDLKGRSEAEIRRRCVESAEAMKVALKERFERAAEGEEE